MTRLRVASQLATSARAGRARAKRIESATPALPPERPMPTMTSAEALEPAGELAGRERFHAEVEFMANRPVEFKARLVVSGEAVVLHAVLREAGDLLRERFGCAPRFAVRHHAIGEAHH